MSDKQSLPKSLLEWEIPLNIKELKYFMEHLDPDHDWVLQAQQGDKHAFDCLVLKYQIKINKLVGHYVFDPQEALDLSQEVFIKAYRALPQFRGNSAFYTWLYRIAINTAKNYVSIKVPDQLNENVVYVRLTENATPEHQAIRDEIEQTLFHAIDSLPEELRMAIRLRELEGLSYEDIAEKMQCPIGTVRSRIFRARECIDKKLKPFFDE